MNAFIALVGYLLKRCCSSVLTRSCFPMMCRVDKARHFSVIGCLKVGLPLASQEWSLQLAFIYAPVAEAVTYSHVAVCSHWNFSTVYSSTNECIVIDIIDLMLLSSKDWRQKLYIGTKWRVSLIASTVQSSRGGTEFIESLKVFWRRYNSIWYVLE